MFHFIPSQENVATADNGARALERALETSNGFKQAAQTAKDAGVDPQIIVAHSGWGAGTFARAVWPKAVFVPYVEWWYRHPSPDVVPEEPQLAPRADLHAQALTMNAPVLLDIAEADAILCPTAFQAAQFPGWLRSRIEVIFDGIDTDLHAPNPHARARLNLYGLPKDAELVTYAARGLGPVEIEDSQIR